jgi:hypothetical protein
VVFSRDQAQGKDWESYCKELEAKIRDLQTRNDALQRVIERYEVNPQIEDQGVVSEENPDDYYQGAIARIDTARREFVAMKCRLDDTEALEQHYRQKFEHQQEAGLLLAAKLDRAKRELDMSEEKRAEMEIRWLELSQEKLRVDLDLQKLQVENASITRSHDEILRQLDAAMKESKRTSAKLERAEALLNARGEPIPSGSSLSGRRVVENIGGADGESESESRSADSGQSKGSWDGDIQRFVRENQALWVMLRSYEEKPANDLDRLIAALREEIERLKAESDQAIQAASRENDQLRTRLRKALKKKQ